MGYKHFGRIGDIWKHFPLCEIVSNEIIETYIETNSGYFDYELGHSEEQDYGIGWFIKKSQNVTELENSQYFKIIKPFYDTDMYLGSCGQVIHIIRNKAKKYIFFDLDKDALISIERAVNELGISHKVETRQMDSATGLINLIPELNQKAFVHIDPYLIHQPNNDGYSYLDGFFEALKRGVKSFLWYGFRTLKEKREINDILIVRTDQTRTKKISCDELIIKEIQEDSININPGVLGCGILTSNLNIKSIGIISDSAKVLVEMYRDSKYKGVNGELYHDKIINNFAT